MKKLFVLALAGFLSLSTFQFSPVSAQSNLTAELLSTISSLQTQVMALQGQIAARSNQNNFPTSTGAWLTVTKSGNGSGLVTSNPAGINCGSDCSEIYATGTIVWLYASASQGSVFNSWTGCDVVSSTSCRVTINYNRIVNARFDLATSTYMLTVTKSGSGSGLVRDLIYPPRIDCGSDCSENYPAGTVVWLAAYANQGSGFGAWTGCDIVSSTQCRVTMNYNRTVNARFDLINSPPEITYVSGPTRLAVNATGTWTVSATDPDGNFAFWEAIWGDNASSTVYIFGTSSESTATFYHRYSTAGLKNIVFKVYDDVMVYDAASTTVNVISTSPHVRPYQSASLIKLAEESLATMVNRLQEMLKALR